MNLLINPLSMQQLGYTPPPLGLLYLASNDPETHILDAANEGLSTQQVFQKIDELKPVVVGVPVYTAGRAEALQILRYAHQRGSITVAGGPHVGIMLKQMREHYGDFINYLVPGDGEKWWKRVTRESASMHAGDSIAGAPHGFSLADPPGIVTDLDALPLPAFDRIDLRKYPPRGGGVYRGIDLSTQVRVSIVFGRGCDGSCTFCSTWWVHGPYHHHSIGWMSRLLELLWSLGVRHLVWQDDCLTVDKPAFLALCDLLKQYNFASFGSTRVDHMDPEIAHAMSEAGFYEVSFGIESGSQYLLDKWIKKRTDLNTAYYARECLRKEGIKFTALMIEGYPGETEETKRETREFLSKLHPDGYGSLGHTMVLPGTALYQWCKTKGLIDDSFWLTDQPYYIYRGGLE